MANHGDNWTTSNAKNFIIPGCEPITLLNMTRHTNSTIVAFQQLNKFSKCSWENVAIFLILFPLYSSIPFCHIILESVPTTTFPQGSIAFEVKEEISFLTAIPCLFCIILSFQ